MLFLGSTFLHLQWGCCAPFLGFEGFFQGSSSSSSPDLRRLQVLVDMDRVLANFEGGFLKKFQARFPEMPCILLEDGHRFWVSEQYGQIEPELSDKAISICEPKDFFLELDPIPGAMEAVKQIAKLEEIYVFICTSPIKKYHYCPYEKYAWVEKHLGPEFLKQIVLTLDKTMVSGDLLIDDRPDVLGAEKQPTWEHILFTACHNKHLELPSSCHRLHSWADDWKAILDSKQPL